VIDTLVGPAQEKIDNLHREIAGLPLDNYTRNENDNDDTVLERENPDLKDLLEEPPRREALALGLGAAKRYNSRQRAVRSAYIGYRYRASIHYTQRSQRWYAIRNRIHANEGQYPIWADCSAFVTWCYWDATRLYRLSDFVNGAGWRAGFTGTMVRHGRIVQPGNLLTGDSIFYGGPWSRPTHVAIYVGNGRVISHGSESGPLLLHYAYRPINHCRRFIR
jgi:NlpC/P60 family